MDEHALDDVEEKIVADEQTDDSNQKKIALLPLGTYVSR